MPTLREQYERETGKKSYRYIVEGYTNSGFTADYVAWLERELNAAHEILDLCCDAPLKLEIAKQTIVILKRRAECAEKLAEASRVCLNNCGCAESVGDCGNCDRLEAALADYLVD